MTTQTETTDKAPKAPKAKTVREDMAQRRIFDSADEAENYLQTLAETMTDFETVIGAEGERLAVRSPVIDDEGNLTLDREVYAQPGMQTMVARLDNKAKKDANGKIITAGAVKAIVCAPVPSLELLLFGADSIASGEAPTLPDLPSVNFVRAIIQKELNHRAVKQLRDAEDVSTVVDTIPTTVEGYIESSRESGGLMEAFDETYRDAIATLAGASDAFKRRKGMLTKPEFRKACESKGYAQTVYEELEADKRNGSLFVFGIKLMQRAATRKGLATDILDRWLATRDSKTYEQAEADEQELEALDLDALAESMLAEDEPANDSATTEGESTQAA